MSAQRTRRIDAIAGAVVLAIAGTMFLAARGEPPATYDPLGSGTAPLWVSGALAILALVLIGKALVGARIAQSQQSMIVGLDGGTPVDYALRPSLAAFAMAATFAYVLALQLGLPFRWATIAFLAALGGAMCDRSRRHLAIAAAIAVLGGVGVDLLFGRLLMVQLP
ncbi:MAG: tripartite tricarboxylate transporter TctB family protein [Alphaproteobacteria bacterium]|nr:tripartite tricarboxylate transporter TctB family protein [Alphaproteobacteria bacterium]